MVKQKSASTSGEIERMAVFPHLRAMLHSTPSAPVNLWSLSTSTASQTPQKQNIGPDPLMKPSSSTVWSNQPQWQSSSDGSRWDCTLFLFSPNSRCDLFVIIINIMNIAIISTIITNSITKVEFDFLQCNTKQWLHLKHPQQWTCLQVNVDVLVCPRHGALDCQRRLGVGPSQQGEVLIKDIDQKDQL